MIKKYIKNSFFYCVLILFTEVVLATVSILGSSTVYAQCNNALGLCDVNTGGAVSKISTTSQVSQLAGNVVDMVIGIAGFLTIVFIVWGGVKMITSAGDAQKVAEGRKIVVAASVGLALVLLSWLIAHLVMQILGVANGYSGGGGGGGPSPGI